MITFKEFLTEISKNKARKYFAKAHSQMNKRDPKTYKKRMDGSVLALKKLDKDDDRVKVHAKESVEDTNKSLVSNIKKRGLRSAVQRIKNAKKRQVEDDKKHWKDATKDKD